jgi:hypothetical protein
MTVRARLAGLHREAGLPPTIIAKAYRLLRRILNVAVEAGYLPRNPCTVKGAGTEWAAEVAGKIIVSPPKTDAGRRVVTLPKVAVEVLAAHLEKYADPDPDALVFTTRRGRICCAVPSPARVDDLARLATAPAKGTARVRKGTQRARRRR